MKKIASGVLCLAILLVLPDLVFSDCVDLGRSTGWYVQSGHTIIFYHEKTPIARVNIPECTINRSSLIRLITNYLCDSDKVIINGEACNIMMVTSASTGSY